jgi:hypothetical protein
MKKIKTFIKIAIGFMVSLIFACVFYTQTASAHDLNPWMEWYTKNRAVTDDNNQFTIAGYSHNHGSSINYFWENTTTKNHFQTAITEGFNDCWGNMIRGSETGSSSAHVKLSYSLDQPPGIAAVARRRGGDANSHFRQGIQSHGNHDSEIVFYKDSAGYNALNKKQLAAHELGHLWGIDDIYNHCNNTSCSCKNRQSIYSKDYSFNTATRHDINSMYIALGNPWYDDGTGIGWKRLKSPNAFFTNEWAENWFFNSDQRIVQEARRINLNRNSGTGGANNVRATLNVSSLIGWSTAPTRVGYIFDGYWTATSGGSRLINSTGALIANVSGYTNSNGQWVRETTTATELYARWTPKTYFVTFDHQGGSSATSGTNVIFGDLIRDVPVPNKTGYDFKGYYRNPNGSGTKFHDENGFRISDTGWNIAEDTTLYAYWMPKTTKVTLDKQGGNTGFNTLDFIYDQTIPDSSRIPVKGYYVFEGYYSQPNGGGTKYYDKNGFSVYTPVWKSTASTLTLYANWVPLADGVYYIKNRYASWYPPAGYDDEVYMEPNNIASNSSVILQESFRDDFQKWRITHQEGGTYILQPYTNSTLYLDIYNAGSNNNTPVQIYSNTGHAAQKFYLQRNAEGFFHIMPSHTTNMALDLLGESRELYTKIILFQYYPGNWSQQWTFEFLHS